MRALSDREARLVAVLLLVALLVLLDFAIVQPIVAGFADRAERREMLLARYAADERIIDAIPRLRRHAEQQRATTDQFALAAPDPGTATELLDERLRRAVEGVGGEFRGAAMIPPRPGWTASRVTARLSMAQLAALLAASQNQVPYIIIDSLVVAADEALVTGRPTILDVQFEATIPVRPAAAR